MMAEGEGSMAKTVTVRLSNELYGRLKRAAELCREPEEVIIAQSLARNLPPLLEEIPVKYQQDVYPLLQMSDEELRQEANRFFSAELWADYEALLEKKRTGSLTPAEQARLNDLRREADVLMFRRSYAAVLLKRRGHSLLTLHELERSSREN